MTVRRLEVGDVALLREIRLEALSESPDAFGSTLKREVSKTTADWERWLSNGATFVCERPDGAQGLIAGVAHLTDPTAVYLVAMWVRPAARGSGAADALVAAVLAWAEARGAASVVLDVGADNHRARRLYERNGFRPTGHEWRRERDGCLEVEMRCPVAGRAGA